MISGSTFRDLGKVIDELEARNMTVLDVMTEQCSLVEEEMLRVDITVGLDSLTEIGTAEDVVIIPSDTGESEEQVTTTFTVRISIEGDRKTASPNAKGTRANNHSGVEGVEVAVDPQSSAEEADQTDTSPMANRRGVETLTTTGTGASGTEDDVPYYKNYERLAKVYEEHDTFAEMTEALEVDVTPATVREHMVNHGIHPTSSNDDDEDTPDVDAQDDDLSSVTAEADGYGLPDGITMEKLVTAVKQARTVHEAQNYLDLERTETRALLDDFDLLDLVTFRLTDNQITEVDEIMDRIHSSSTA